MSLYRQTGRPRAARLVAVGLAALLAGVALGFALGRSSAPEPSLAEAIEQVHTDLQPVGNALELIPNEYEQAFRGEGVEARGVAGIVARMRDELARVKPDLQALDPEGARTLERDVAALEAAVRAKARPAEVRRLTAAAANALASLPGGR